MKQLSKLKKAFNFSIMKKWLKKNPFDIPILEEQEDGSYKIKATKIESIPRVNK